MIAPLTSNTQAILLLTAPLIIKPGQASPELLTLSEYNRLARLLREKQNEPADLMGPDAESLIALGAKIFGQTRLESLLGRGFLLSQAVDRWNSRGIWVVSRADISYRARLKERLKEYAPPLLYGCGDISLLKAGGLAVVGSRHVDVELIEFTENVGRLAARSHQALISGGAKGIDQAAMRGAVMAGGIAVGIMADSLERAALAHDNRESLMDHKLVLVSPYDPAAGFNVGNAMQRNKFIYALANAALVVTADFEKGGSWTGAIEQLDRFHFVPLFVRTGANEGKGIMALMQRGAIPWPNPHNDSDLGKALSEAAASVAPVPVQETLPLLFEEKPAHYKTERKVNASDPPPSSDPPNRHGPRGPAH